MLKKQLLLLVFQDFPPPTDRTDYRNQKFITYKISIEEITKYINEANQSTNIMPEFNNSFIQPSQQSLDYWLSTAVQIQNNIQAQSIALFLTYYYTSNVHQEAEKQNIKINRKDLYTRLNWSSQKLTRFFKKCKRIHQLSEVVGVAGAATLSHYFTSTDIDEVANSL